MIFILFYSVIIISSSMDPVVFSKDFTTHKEFVECIGYDPVFHNTIFESLSFARTIGGILKYRQANDDDIDMLCDHIRKINQ